VARCPLLTRTVLAITNAKPSVKAAVTSHTLTVASALLAEMNPEVCQPLTQPGVLLLKPG
jgi:hypothetical protein